MKRSIQAIADRWMAAQRFTAAAFMIVMTGLYGFNVLARTFVPEFAGSLAWIDTAARYMMIWVVFLAVGAALASGHHVAVDLAWRNLPPYARQLIFKLIDVTGLLFSALMIVLAVRLTILIAETGQVSPSLAIPTYVLYVAPVIGFASLAIVFFLRLIGIYETRHTPPGADWIEGRSA